jgi:hypothetical protein
MGWKNRTMIGISFTDFLLDGMASVKSLDNC